MTSQPGGPEAGGSAIARAQRWLEATFAGLTWSRFAIYCLLLLPFALSRPSTVAPLINGAGWAAVALGTGKGYLLTWLRFTPTFLAVVMVGQPRAPRRMAIVRVARRRECAGCGGRRRALWLGNPVALRQSSAPPGFRQRQLLDRGVALGGSRGRRPVLTAMATAFAFHLKRSADAAAALQRKAHDREQIDREHAEARVAIMQAQIEPHFLFNTLASIRRLYETDAVAGKSMLLHLSRYLAASLPILRESRSTLGREVALAVAYLNVQKIRMGSRLRSKSTCRRKMQATEVPPMMIVTLVENCVIHGLAPLPQGGRVRISARTEGTRTRDRGRRFRTRPAGRMGRGRRPRQHSRAASFAIRDQADLALHSGMKGGVIAIIDLPLDPPMQPLAA